MAATQFNSIPVIDVSPLAAGHAAPSSLVEELTEACHEVGFVLILNHGISEELQADVFEMMHRFFSLPADRKGLIDKRSSRHFRGWEPLGTEYTNNRPDIREQIDCWTEWPAREQGADPHYLRLLGPNQWLPDDVLPGHKKLSNQWSEALSAVAAQLLGVLWTGLGLSPSHLRQFIGDEPMSLTKLIHYPATPPGAAGVNAHHDIGFLTILATGQTPGLQVQNPAGQWIDVPAVPGSLVVNLGESLQAMTGNYLVATPHRVLSEVERYASGHFYGPSLHASLEPLPLATRFAEAVAASPRHTKAGFMAPREELQAGVGDMASDYRPSTYGEQLWNYFARSYPEIVGQAEFVQQS